MKPADLRRLAAAGLDAEQIAVVMEIMDDDAEDRRAKGRARWRKHQENKRNSNVSSLQETAAANSRGGVTRVEDKTSNSEIEPQKEERNALTREFAEFWAEYPNKVGKPKAQASFVAARKRASLETILAGLRRYVECKPADRAWMNPTTFLNQDRWADQPAAVIPMAQGPPRRGNPLMAALNDISRGHDDDNSRPAETTVRYLPAAVAR